MKTIKSIVALAISASLPSINAFAFDTTTDKDLETISVYGDFRTTNLNKTASSLSVLTSQESELRSAQNLEDAIALVPNVNFSSGSQRARYYQIRGIGERSQFQEPINPSVGLVIDDIDFSGIGSIASMFDVAQTEVYRGPQGTKFGANAMAGLIDIRTNAPTDTFEGAVKLSAGNYDSYGAGIVLSGPAADGVNYRFAIEQYRSDGFIDNTYLQRDDTNNRDELSVRGKLAIQATDDLTIDITAFYFDFDNGYDTFSLDNNRNTLSDQPGFDDQETTAIGTKFTYQGFDFAEFRAKFSYADSDLAYGYDEDWAYVGIHPWEYSSTDHYFRDRTTSTAEFTFTSREDNAIFSNTTAWVFGVYFKQDDEDLTREYTYQWSDFSSSFDTDTYAAFVQFDTQLDKKWALTTGLRVEERQADYSNSSQLTFDPTDTMVGGKVVLSYQQDENTLWYGSVNRGYKAGGVNTDGTLPDNLREFGSEFLWNYELGYKVSFWDNQAYVRSAIFYMDRHDIQVKSSQDIIREDGSSEFIIYLDNAAKGHNQGIEIDAAWQVNTTIELYGALGILDTEFSDFVNANGDSNAGRDQAHAPHYQYSVGINYSPSQQWLVNVSVDGKDEFYFSDSHSQKSSSVNVVNASVNYLQDDWKVNVWVRNAFDEDYETRGFYFGNDPRDFYTAKAYHQYGEPAVFGVTFDMNF